MHPQSRRYQAKNHGSKSQVSTFDSPRTNKDVPGLEKDLLVDGNEMRRSQLRQKMSGVSTGKSSTAKTGRMATSSTYPEMEVGRYYDGLCDWYTPF